MNKRTKFQDALFSIRKALGLCCADKDPPQRLARNPFREETLSVR